MNKPTKVTNGRKDPQDGTYTPLLSFLTSRRSKKSPFYYSLWITISSPVGNSL